MKRKKLWKFLRVLISIYIAIGVMLYFVQDIIIFHPKALSQNYSFQFNQPFKEINISPDGRRNLNFIQFFPAGKAKGIVLYFHGNKTNINRYAQFAGIFTKNDYEVWMIDYPGYGKTTGKRTEQTIYTDALLFYQLAIQKTGAENIIIYGKSLGTGVATYLASGNTCKKLLLETPYYSMSSMTRHYVPVYPAVLLRYSFPTNEYLKKIKVPVTIFHGTSDEVIPYNQSKKLKAEFPMIDLVSVPNGSHNNLYKFPAVIQKLDSLLAK
jgi:alpha-beta hydrolase superfamily lysophospholipase